MAPGSHFDDDVVSPAWAAPLRTAAQALLDLIYPPRCAGCGRPGVLFCSACLASVVAPPEETCPRCGQPAAAGGGLCNPCRHRPLILDGILASGAYAPPLRQVIHAFKYDGLRALAEPLAGQLAATWLGSGQAADVIVPVPLHSRREAERGYNQSALLANNLSRCIGLPVDTQTLVRQRATPAQVSRTAAERRANVAGAFVCKRSVAGLRIMLVDDVCTTGSTLEACGIALRTAGAREIWGLALARGSLQTPIGPKGR